MESPQRAPFGETLATFRTRVGLSQQQLANLVGKTRRAVAAWEAGEYLPKAKGDVLSLARILKLDEEEITILLTTAGMDPLLSLWNVPYHRNPYFTGRDELLKQLDQYLAPSERMASAESRHVALTQPHAVSGLGGIGKTQVAVEYAYRSREQNRYTHILWANAANKENLFASFVEIASLVPAVVARNEPDQSKLIEAVKRWLEQCRQPWLLIFDNVDDDSLPGIWEYLPQGGKGSVLLTTRASAVGSLATPIEVETMGFVEGSLLLLRRAHRAEHAFDLEHMSDEEVNQLHRAGNVVEVLDHFPLALDQAGAYIEETQCSFEEYLEVYQTHRQKLLAARGKPTTDYPDSVATTWSLSFQRVQQANPAAAELLELCAYLSPDRIPEELITDGAAYWPALLQQAASDPFAFQQLSKELLKYSLMKRLVEDRALSIHRLVQAVLRDAMDGETQRRWAERVVQAINAVFPDDPQDLGDWPRCLQYLDQAQVCHILIERYGFCFVEAADVLNRAGLYLSDHGLYPLAQPLYQRALAIWEKQLGVEHPDIASSLNNLASLYRDQGKYEEAEPLYVRALAIWEKQLGAEHPETARCLNNLAALYRDQGKDAEAEPLYIRALAIWEREVGAEHPETARCLNNLAALYASQGKYAEAELLYVRALAIWEWEVGAEHPETARCLNNLAALYDSQGKYEEAEPLYVRALTIREKQLGARHPDTASSLNNLAYLYENQGKYEEAEPLYVRALTTWEREVGAEHPETARCLNNLAGLYRNQGKYAEAQLLYVRALAIWENVLGQNHPSTQLVRENYTTLLEARKQVQESED